MSWGREEGKKRKGEVNLPGKKLKNRYDFKPPQEGWKRWSFTFSFVCVSDKTGLSSFLRGISRSFSVLFFVLMLLRFYYPLPISSPPFYKFPYVYFWAFFGMDKGGNG